MLGTENLTINLLIGGAAIILLIVCAEVVVKRLTLLAKCLGVSNTFIGLTVLSITTSLPEIGSHIIASIGILTKSLDYKIASSTVLGANIGSDVVQQTFVLGMVILFVGHLTFSKTFLKRSYSMMVGTTLLTLLLGWDRTISRIDGIILLAVFVWYMHYLYSKQPKVTEKKIHRCATKDVFVALIGMVVLLFSAHIILKTTEIVVHQTNLGASLIGVFSLGVASALPEMFTAIAGVKNKATGISVGTLIGSNITNPLLAIGLGGLLSTYFVPQPLVYWDLPMETITAALLLIWLFKTKGKIGRYGAIYLILLYVVYSVVRIFFFGID